MAENKENPAAGNPAAEGSMAPNTENNGAEGNPNEGGDGNNQGDGNGGENQPNAPATKPKDPVVRNNAFFAGLRMGEKKAKEVKVDDKGGDSTGDNPQGVEDIINERLKPFQEQQFNQQIDSEVDQYINEFPELKEFSETVKNYARHDSRKEVPTATLFLEAVGMDGIMQLGVDRYKASVEKAGNSQNSGTSSRDSAADVNKVDFGSMSPEEFQAWKDKNING